MKRLMILLVLLSGAAFAQDDPPQTPEKRLQEAWYMEVANGRYEEALAIYRDILEDPSLPILTRVQTQIRMAHTLQRLGRQDESRAIAEDIVRRYQPWAENDPRVKKAMELTLEIGTLQRKVEKSKTFLTEEHPELVSLQKELHEKRAQLSDLQQFLLSEQKAQELWTMAETARGELLAEDAEQATLRRKIESLIERLSSDDQENRTKAIGALMEVGPEVVPFALEALRSGDFYSCEGAALILVSYAKTDLKILPTILTALRSSDKIARDALSESLADWEWPETVVFEMMKDESPAVRTAAMREVLNFGKASSYLDAVIGALSDPAAEVRELAVTWAMKAGRSSDEIRSRFASFAADGDVSVRLAFARTAAREVKANELPQIIRALIPLLKDPNVDVARNAAAALSRAAYVAEAKDAVPPALTAEEGKALLDGVAQIFEMADASTRTNATSILRLAPGNRSRDMLLARLEDPSFVVAMRATVELGQYIDDPQVVRRLVELIPHPELGQNTTQHLMTWLNEPLVRDALLEHLFELPESLLTQLIQHHPEASIERTLDSLDEFERWSPRVQHQLLQVIANLKLERAAPTVVQALRSGDAGLVKQALGVVNQVPAPDFVAPVIELLGAEDPQILLGAIGTASRLNAPELVEPLGKLLSSNDANLRRAAAYQLMQLDFPSRLPWAAQALTSEDDQVVDRAKNIIDRLLWERNSRPVIEALIPLLERIRRPGWPAVDSAFRRGGNASDAQILASHLADAPAWMQEGILQLLRLLKSPEVLPQVRPLLEAPEASVRREAQLTLLEIGDFEDIRSLVDSDFGTNAIRSLGQTGDERAIPILLEQLRSSTGGRAATVVEALEPFARASFISALVENALSKQAAWKTFKRKIADGQERQWQELASVRTLVHYPVDAALEGLARVLESDVSDAVREEAIETLTRFDSVRARELILGQLDSEAPSVRTHAIEALGTFLDADLLPMLVDLLRHRLPEVREAARISIEKIRFYLEQKRYAERVVRGEPTGELAELIALLAHDEPAVRVAAAESLGRIGDAAALPALIRARKDPDERVQKAIEAALDALTK